MVLSSQAAVGAVSGTGLLGASTPTALDGFVARDVAVAGGAIYAIGGNTLVILRPAADLEGTFALPQVVRVTGLPSARILSIATGDVDRDGQADVALGVEASDGQTWAFRVAFLNGAAIAATPPGRSVPASLFKANGRPLAIVIDRLDGDAFGDIAYVEEGEQGRVLLIISAAGSFGDPGVQVLTVPLGVPVTNRLQQGAPRLIDSAVLNVSADGADPVDGSPDLAVATGEGTLLLVNTIPSAPPLVPRGILSGGTGPKGVIAADVTGDGLVDLIMLDAGKRTLSISLAAPPEGYVAPNVVDFVAEIAAPNSAIVFYDGSNLPNLAITDVGSPDTPGQIVILTGTTDGVFTFREALRGADVGIPALRPVTAASIRRATAPDDLVIANSGETGAAPGIGFLSGVAGYRVVPLPVVP